MKTLLLILSTLPMFGQVQLTVQPAAWTIRNATYNGFGAVENHVATAGKVQCPRGTCDSYATLFKAQPGASLALKVPIPFSNVLNYYDLFPCQPGQTAGNDCLNPFYGPTFAGSLATAYPYNLDKFGTQVQADFAAGVVPVLTATLALIAAPDTVFIPTHDWDWNTMQAPACTGGLAFVRLYVSGVSDIGSTVRGYRWYATTAAQLIPGASGVQNITLTVPVDSAHWTDVFAGTVDQYPAQFAASFANPQSIQIAMGSNGCAGANHQIAANNATGAQVGLVLTGYSIQ